MKNLVIVLISLLTPTCNIYAQLHFVKTVTVTNTTEGGSARPEIVATANRVFVLYLGDITAGENRAFKLKIYKSNLDTVVTSKVLVSRTSEYGSPTDIRTASDGQYLYVFYETNKPTSLTTAITYLWAAKYTLNDSFDRIAYATVPITNSKPMAELQDGGELIDDPAPLVGSNSVFVVTRLKYSLAIAGKTIYRVREFSKNDLTMLNRFDLDLSSVADGRGRVTSLTFWNNNIYIALATTVSDVGLNENVDDGAKSDIKIVKMMQNWNFTPESVKTISANPNDVENYVCGLESDSNYFYLTYKQSIGTPPAGEHRAWIKVFDKNFNLLDSVRVRSTVWGPGGGELRPSLEIFGNRIYSGQSAGQFLGSGNAEVYVYEMNVTSVRDDDSVIPKDFFLSQNYPNPFNPTTTIRFTLRISSLTSLKVYDVLGREVATLVNGELNPGEHTVVLDAKSLASGVYFYQLRAAGFIQTKKMLVTK